MRRHSTFRTRLLLTLLGFVLLAEIAVAAAILRTTYDRTIAQARNSLEVGNRVLDRLISLRAEQLLSTVDILTSDFGFRSAVATNDGPTLRSTLVNFGDRVQADMVILTNTNGEVTATLPAAVGDNASMPLANLLDKARKSGRAAGLAMVGDRPYQFVLLPVKAPRLIAWVGMGFDIDRALAQRLSDLTGLNVEFSVTQAGAQVYQIRTGSDSPSGGSARDDTNKEGQNKTAADKAAGTSPDRGFIRSEHILLDAGDTRLQVVLSLSRADVMAGYYELAQNLILIFFVTLLISSVVALWLAKKLSKPVGDLSAFAESVAAGRYSEAPEPQSVGEFDVLADALNDMQAAVNKREKRIRHQATHDALTGLPNRESIRQTLDTYFRGQREFAVARIAIHGFSRINGAIGYQLGDEVLKTTADRLRAAVHEAHPLGRVEGNDFLLILETGGDENEVLTQIERIRSGVQAPVHVIGTPVTVTLEIGVVFTPRLADDVETIWRRSVLARDGSRRENGRTFFYQSGMDEAHRRELTIIRDLGPALRNNELDIAYQPKMVLGNGLVKQVEALARWRHPKLGFVAPDEFIGLAERSGQINLLTQWIVGALTQRLEDWRNAGMTMGVAINLSGDEIANTSLEDMLAPLIEAASSPDDITLEVTESALLRDPTAALGNLRRLQGHGARVAIDDFGTGYSSFGQLKQLGANELKIDKSLILHLETTPADQFIVRTIIDLGHQLGLEVVAEGIENAASWRYLVEHGADLMQGYYLAKPMAFADLTTWVRAHHSKQAQWSSHFILDTGGNPL